MNTTRVMKWATILATLTILAIPPTLTSAKPPRTWLNSWRQQRPQPLEVEEVPEMALNAWICPGTEGSWGDVNNWLLGIIPIDTHDVQFGSWSQADVVDGFNQTGVDLASLWIQPAYGGDIGSAANALLIDAVKVRHEGSGLLHFKNDGSSPTIVIDSPNRDQAAIIDGTGVTSLMAKRGVINVAASAGDVTLIVSYTYSPGEDAIVTLPASANKLAALYMTGGIVTSFRDIQASLTSTEPMVAGGQLFTEGTAASASIVVAGGYWVNNSTGTFAATTILGGTVDATQKLGTRVMTMVQIHGGDFLYSDLVTHAIYDYRNDGPRP